MATSRPTCHELDVPGSPACHLNVHGRYTVIQPADDGLRRLRDLTEPVAQDGSSLLVTPKFICTRTALLTGAHAERRVHRTGPIAPSTVSIEQLCYCVEA